MILYNVTVSIDPEVAEEWILWMKETHIPDVMSKGCFIEARFSRVHGEEEGGHTYAIGYLAKSEDLFDLYQQNFSQTLQADHHSKFGGKFAAFRTKLSVIEEFKP